MSLTKQIHDMRAGDHACMIYNSEKEQLAAVLPFIRAGLDKKESCLYVVNDHSLVEIENAFADFGIDVDAEVRKGALKFGYNTLQDGVFDPAAMVGFLKEQAEEAEDKGFAGFRASGEMSWVLGGSCGCGKIIEYEAMLNEHFPTTLTAICQYHREHFAPLVIRDILRTHQVIIVGETVCRNLYCESRRILEAENDHDYGVNWMIDNLVKFGTLEQHLTNLIQMRDDFIAIMGHELRTPLTGIKLRNEMQLARTNRSDPGALDTKSFIQTNLRGLHHLINIVESMLDVNKITRGTLPISKVHNIDLVDLAILSAHRFESEMQIEIHHNDAIRGRWDPTRIQEVFTNLFSNALKYGAGKPVHVRLSNDQSNAYIAVEDQGIGIASTDQKRIFDRFERAIAYTNISGLGLGLYICDVIVRAHGGHISVKSRVGKGSTFMISLPLQGEAQADLGSLEN